MEIDRLSEDKSFTPSPVKGSTPADTEICFETGPVTVNPEKSSSGQPPAIGGKDESPSFSVEQPKNIESSNMLEFLPNLEVNEVDKLDSLTDEVRFHIEVNRWEEFYDQMLKFLMQDKKVSIRGYKNILRAAEHYSLGSDGNIYYSKLAKDGTELAQLLVVRDYSERVRICRSIHLDTGHAHLHNRRDKMLDLVGRKYFWKGQRRDICQCIASCEVCSTGLGAKRRTKPPAQKRDVPHGGPPTRKKAKMDMSHHNGGKTKTKRASKVNNKKVNNKKSHSCKNDKFSAETTSAAFDIDSSDLSTVQQLPSLLPDVSQTRTEDWVEQLQPVLVSEGKGEEHGGYLQSKPQSPSRRAAEEDFSSERGRRHSEPMKKIPVLYVGPAEDSEGSKHNTGLQTCTEEDSSSDQAASTPLSVEGESPHCSPVGGENEVSIYKLLFNVPSTSSEISPSVIEAVHLGMKETADVASCLEVFNTIMCQILSLGPEHCVVVSPCPASAYCVAIFACMMAVDPLSLTSGVCSRNLPLAVIHDTCCAHFHQGSRSGLEPGMLKMGTGLTGCYNWNLGDPTHSMDGEALRMALRSNRVAGMFYQPYAYTGQSQHLSLREMGCICHSQDSTRPCNVSIVVDGTDMLSYKPDTRNTVVPEVKGFLEQGADAVLLPSLDKLGGVSQSCVLVGMSSLLGNVRESMAALQSQVCLPLFCQSRDLVDTIVTFKTMLDS